MIQKIFPCCLNIFFLIGGFNDFFHASLFALKWAEMKFIIAMKSPFFYSMNYTQKDGRYPRQGNTLLILSTERRFEVFQKIFFARVAVLFSINYFILIRKYFYVSLVEIVDLWITWILSSIRTIPNYCTLEENFSHEAERMTSYIDAFWLDDVIFSSIDWLDVQIYSSIDWMTSFFHQLIDWMFTFIHQLIDWLIGIGWRHFSINSLDVQI